ncbi:MAG: HAMP domain-containing protein [Anaerolineales bacterium]|nr:HAMP domain-containing protein [Anaerolineales bacterium]
MKISNYFVAPFRQLRWKLTLSYTLVTVGALLVLEVVFLVGLSNYVNGRTSKSPNEILTNLNRYYAPVAAEYLSSNPPDEEGLREFLHQMKFQVLETEPIQIGDFVFDVSSANQFQLSFFNASGMLLTTIPRGGLGGAEPGAMYDAIGVPSIEEPVRTVLESGTDLNLSYAWVTRNELVGAVPVHDEFGKERIVGAIAFTQQNKFWNLLTFTSLARQAGIGLVFITIFAALFGTAFGFLTAHGLVQRLKRIFISAEAWSEGDFSVYVDDQSGDELSRLAQGLNNMADQLKSLLEERQQLSVMEERNRLARDLHDSVKQEAFAASAQLGAAITHVNSGSHEAEFHLRETEKLLDEVRQDLTDLIQELRPVVLKDRGLVAAVREYASDCANQSDLNIDVHINGERPLPLEIEQALFRIVQGALANVVRHSGASLAEVRLTYQPTRVSLIIRDNGHGFDLRKIQNGVGLRSIRERAAIINAHLSIESRINEGTTITVNCIC